MRELDGRRLPRRTLGRSALLRRLQALLIQIHRFGKGRARTAEDVAWASETIAALSSLVRGPGSQPAGGGAESDTAGQEIRKSC